MLSLDGGRSADAGLAASAVVGAFVGRGSDGGSRSWLKPQSRSRPNCADPPHVPLTRRLQVGERGVARRQLGPPGRRGCAGTEASSIVQLTCPNA
jgi:hypothetical protein